MKFKVKLVMNEFVQVDEEFRRVEVKKDFEARNWDDFQNLIATLIEASVKETLTFEVRKEETDEEDAQ